MADRLIAINTAAPAGQQLPEVVRDELGNFVSDGPTTMDRITDLTDIGRAVGGAESQAAARTAIGAAAGINLYEVTWSAGSENNTVGANGDYAINNGSGLIWGPKAAGAWPAPKLLGTGEVSVGAGLPGEIVPQAIAGVWTNATRSLSNGVAYLMRWRPLVARSLVSVAFEVSTAAGNNDNVDIGIYTISGDGTTLTRVTSSGATAGLLNSTGVKNVALLGTYLPNTTYVVALSAEVTGTAPTLSGRGCATSATTGLFGAAFPRALAGTKGSSYPLPSTISSPSFGANSFPLMALREI